MIGYMMPAWVVKKRKFGRPLEAVAVFASRQAAIEFLMKDTSEAEIEGYSVDLCSVFYDTSAERVWIMRDLGDCFSRYQPTDIPQHVATMTTKSTPAPAPAPDS